jgi:hypothetical protein
MRVVGTGHQQVVLLAQHLTDDLDPALAGHQQAPGRDPLFARLTDQVSQGTSGGFLPFLRVR